MEETMAAIRNILNVYEKKNIKKENYQKNNVKNLLKKI